MERLAKGRAAAQVPDGPARWVRGRFPLAAQVTIGTAQRRPRFGDPALALEVFMLLRENPRTLAAVVMPDHVHWLVGGGWDLAEVVGRFKEASMRQALAGGDPRPLWQRSFFDAPVESEPVVRLSADYLLTNPVAAGLAGRWQDYPWAYLTPKLGG